MSRVFFSACLFLGLIGLFFAPACWAEKKLYGQADYDLVKKWHKEITGKELADKAYRQAISSLDDGSMDLEELRTSFVNSEDGKKNLSVINRMFWGYLARPATQDETKAIEDFVAKITDPIEKQIEGIINHRELRPHSGITGANLLSDLKASFSLEEARKAIQMSDEYANLCLRELYKRYLGREADEGGLGDYRRQFRERPGRVFIPEFWRRVRMSLLNSQEGAHRHPNKADRLFLAFYRRFPSDNDRKNFENRSDAELSELLDCSDGAMRHRMQQVYRWIFGFEADSGGLKYWTDEAIKSLRAWYRNPMLQKLGDAMCPVINRIQDFAQNPPDVMTNLAIAQQALAEEVRSREEIKKTEKETPEMEANKTNQEVAVRDLFEEYVLRIPTDAEVSKIIKDGEKKAPPKGGKAEELAAKAKAMVISSKEFAAAAKVRLQAFRDLYKRIFFKEPDAKEAEKRTKELNSGAKSIKDLEKEYMTSPAFKDELTKITQALAKGELPPFEIPPLSPEQLKFIESMVNQLGSLNIEFASQFRNLLFREPTDEEMDAFVAGINKMVGALGLSLLPTGKIDPKSLEAFRKNQGGKLKDLPKIAKDAIEGLKKQLLSSPEFKDLAATRDIYLTRLYQEVLGREPDAAGLKHWLEKLSRGEATLDGIKSQMMKTPEFLKYQEALKNYSKLLKLESETDDQPGNPPGAEPAPAQAEEIRSLRDIKPFEKFEFADKVSVKDVQKKEKGKYVEYTGKASFFGLKDEDFFAGNTKDAYGFETWVAGIIFDRTWTPEQYFSGDTNPAVLDLLKILKLNGGALIISLSDVTLNSDHLPENFHKFLDPIYKTTRTDDFRLSLTLGLNLLGRFSLDHEPIKTVMDFFHSEQKEILIHGILTKELVRMGLKAYFQRFNTPEWMSKYVSTIQPMFEITGKPSIAMSVTLKTQLEKDITPLDFTGKIDIPCKKCDEYTLIGSMAGTWENVLGLKGFHLSNLMAKYKPNKNYYAVKGTAQFGTRIVSMSANPPTVPAGPYGVRGAINELNLDDLILLANKMGINVRHENLPLPQIGLRNMDVMMSGVDDPAMNLQKGFLFDGRLLFNGDDIAKAHIRKWAVGIECQAQCNPIGIGPLKFNGGEPGKGPMIDIVLKPFSAHAKLEGKVDLFGAVRELQVWLTKERIMIESTTKLWDAFESHWKIEGTTDFKKPTFMIESWMKADFLDKLTELVDKLTKDRIPDIVKKYISKFFEIKEAGYKGSLDACISGNVPGFWVKFKCLGKTYTLNTIFNFKEPLKAADEFALKLGEEIVARHVEFGHMMEEKIKQAVQKVKDAVAAAVKKAADTVKGWFGKNKGSGPSRRDVDARYLGYSVSYW